jgi:hypothetical protein
MNWVFFKKAIEMVSSDAREKDAGLLSFLLTAYRRRLERLCLPQLGLARDDKKLQRIRNLMWMALHTLIFTQIFRFPLGKTSLD